MVVLKKSDILKGINDPRKIQIDSLDGELWLRPLSSAEINEVLNIEAAAYGKWESTTSQKGKRLEKGESLTKGNMDLAKLTKAEAEAKFECVFRSLDNPKNQDDPWTQEEVQQLHQDAIDEIHAKVFEMSGVNTTEEDVKNFPEDE